ncbi:HhH-GPD-type base excision DNA repair protein [Microbacterium helvum]|uniref:HhH-GPD-type base excision DNA repair protein n=1 Tax=Microbacterium helvum TaxID=2773713 RepID=UPI001CD147F4|nr:HhH-GPD-type base excision DNA repair protein [Microbacterium helvum]
MALHITGDTAADTLLTDDPLALLIGMLLDQQVAMETAFAGPLKISERAGTLDAAAIATFDPDAFAELFKATPAVHRFPGSMAARVQALCAAVQQDWNDDAAAIWTTPAAGGAEAPDGATVLTRLKALPGFGEQKAKIFLALLGKQYGYTGEGWREASAPYGEDGSFRSVADIVSPDSLAKVREHKRAMKVAAGGAMRRRSVDASRGKVEQARDEPCRNPGEGLNP